MGAGEMHPAEVRQLIAGSTGECGGLNSEQLHI